MKLVDTLKSLLLEKKGDNYDTGCVMLYFNFPQIKEIHKKINQDDIYTEEGDRTYGLEDEPHTTLLFGLDLKVQLDQVVEILDQFTFSKCEIDSASLFDNKGKKPYDVLKFDVQGSILHEVNKALRKLPYKNEFPKYHPHFTIGYIKPGEGQKYVDEFKGLSFELMPRYAIFSQPSGEEHKITIKIKNKS